MVGIEESVAEVLSFDNNDEAGVVVVLPDDPLRTKCNCGRFGVAVPLCINYIIRIAPPANR